MNESQDRDRLAQRVTDLESLFLHLERQVGELDAVVREQAKTLDELLKRHQKLAQMLVHENPSQATDGEDGLGPATI